MSAGLAHEINNPLGNVLGYARLLAETQTPSVMSREKNLNRIAEQARKGSSVVQGLLDFLGQSVSRREAVSSYACH